MSIKIVFFGTPFFAAEILKALIEKKVDVAAVVAQPDKKVGRRQEIVFSPAKKLAVENGIKVFQPENLRDAGAIREIGKIGADLFVVAAYGKILPKELLKIPKYGAINIHASLLPKYRGASPIQCAIAAGEKETGITLMRMNEKMDEGDILVQKKIEIGENEAADELSGRLAKLGAETVAKFIPGWIGGKINPVPQDGRQATFCKPIKREDGKIGFGQSAEEIYRMWRAYRPWPGIFAFYKGKRFKLAGIKIIPGVETGEKTGKIVKYNQSVAVQAGRGLIALEKVQLEGKKEMSADDFVKGDAGFVGGVLV